MRFNSYNDSFKSSFLSTDDLKFLKSCLFLFKGVSPSSKLFSLNITDYPLAWPDTDGVFLKFESFEIASVSGLGVWR